MWNSALSKSGTSELYWSTSCNMVQEVGKEASEILDTKPNMLVNLKARCNNLII